MTNYSLKKYELDDSNRVRYIQYNIKQDGFTWGQSSDGCKTTFDQDLNLRCCKYGNWSAQMNVCGYMDMSSPRDAVGKLGVWLRAMADALEKLGDEMEYGVENPVDKNDNYRYSVEGLIEKLKSTKCPLKPLD